ncbi:DUF4355 domain-containing protein [Clostridium saudiense]|uniref:DUF4355 domain-containing protein n=1 Tax=Clostridium TaxID=1485 RepID=UPI00266FFA98|nr:DUF4355 domain-containing protein [Clostridium saudiense]
MENNITSQEGVVKQTQIEGIENQDNHINLPKTEEELQALLQREADRRVSQAQKKWQEKQDAIIKAEKEEATKLAKMSAAEREKAEFEKEKAEFLAEKARMEEERLLSQTEKELVLKGLSSSFAKYVIANTAEEINNNINSLKELFDKAVNKAVNERIATPAPRSGTGSFQNKKRENLMEAIKSKRVR